MERTSRLHLTARSHRRRGSALVIVTFLLAIISVMAVSLVTANVFAGRQARQLQDSLSAMYASEAGIGAAVFDLEHGGEGNVGDEKAPATFGSNSYWVQATDMGDGFVALESTGTSNRTRTRVELIVRVAASGFFQWGAFGDEGMTMESNARVDSYDSRDGDYQSQYDSSPGDYANANGDVGSNVGVALKQNAEVWGDAIPGPGNTTTVVGNAIVSGATTPATTTQEMPPLDIPVIADTGLLYVGGNDSASLPPGEYNFSSFQLDSNATLNIVGPATIVCTDWALNSNAEVYVDATNGGVEIFVLNDFTLSSNTLITSLTHTPADIQINLESDNVIDPSLNVDLDSVDFESNAQLYGTVYAPNARISINSNFELFGSVVARSVHLDSNSRIHFDESLAYASSGESIDYEAVCWRVRAVPQITTHPNQY